jgi:membrane protease subunit (stomatin/prohibitin family)
MAVFVNEGQVADVFGPGMYKLSTQTLPILTYLKNWDKLFESPFKSDVYFFSTRQQVDQKWGTPQPVTIRDKDFGAVRMRGFGVYSWHLENPKAFHTKVSGTRELVRVGDIEPQIRQTIVSHMSDAFAESGIPFLDMAANLVEVAARIKSQIAGPLSDLGIAIDQFVVENLSLPEELQKLLDQRIGMNMIGNMQQYLQYQAAQSLPIAAANEGGGLAAAGAGLGAGLGLGAAMTQALSGAMNPVPPQQPPQAPPPMGGAPPVAPVPVTPTAPAAPAGETKFCSECGQKIPRPSKFCP